MSVPSSNEDRLAQALTGGAAATEEMAKRVQWIELRGGPLEGKTAPEGQDNPLPELRLMHLADSPDPSADMQPVLLIHVYRRQAGVRYVYRETVEEPIFKIECAEIKAAAAILDKLATLITDKRLVAEASAQSGVDDPLPLGEARKLRRRAIARYRRNANEQG